LAKIKHHVKSLRLAAKGNRRIEWAGRQMPVVKLIQERFIKEKPLKGVRIAACLHVTSETANLAIALKAGGARVILCASNPLSTQDEVAASLVRDHGIAVYAVNGENRKSYYSNIQAALDQRPHITMDDGADLVNVIHSERNDLAENFFGGTEETTTGVVRLKALEKSGMLLFPVISVNDAATKHFFDNRYGTGQSTFDGILRATNYLIAGSTVVVCGYGWCGRGVASRAKGLGARVLVTEVDPIRGIEAVMDGFEVLPMSKAALEGDIFITVTGNCSVLRAEHFKKMKSGAIIANSGHFDVEIDVKSLKKMSSSVRPIRKSLDEFSLGNGSRGKKIYLLSQGRLVNLSAAEGHPGMVMDMSFANQALAAEYMTNNYASLKRQVYPVPEDIDREIARIKLGTMGVRIDHLTGEQKEYLSAWTVGT